MKNLLGYPLPQLEEVMAGYNQTKFRATQLYTWMYEQKVRSFDEMTNVSASFRDVLKQDFSIAIPTVVSKQVSLDGTIKLLVELEDKAHVETVLMRYDYGNSICVTSQVGCNMGCTFCASGLLKKQRDLLPHEMVGQILIMQAQMAPEERISHLVVMGTGEPFDNYDNVLAFLKIINHPKGLSIGARHITVSTSGIPKRIRQFASEPLQVNLAISLHAPNDQIRGQLMPINKAFPLAELLAAVRDYETRSKRRVTFEYILLNGVNDSLAHADELAQLIKGFKSYVNLIPYNAISEKGYQRPSRETIKKFQDRLVALGVNVTVRKEFGHDIDAACGQLRAKESGRLKP